MNMSYTGGISNSERLSLEPRAVRLAGDKDEGIQTMLLAMVEGWRHREVCDM